MQQTMTTPWIKLKEYLDPQDYKSIQTLQRDCVQNGPVALKLELDYKREDSDNSAGQDGIRNINEFLYFDGERLIGYIGICGFGNEAEPLEITGMVHPQYRRMGVFTKLFGLVMAECKRRSSSGMLGLCDQSSPSGQGFLKRIGAQYQYSEYEMVLCDDRYANREKKPLDIQFLKATNADAREVTRQNAVFFGDRGEECKKTEANGPLPEEEEKRGMTIYLVKNKDRIIGKVHLQLLNGIGGIYGFGVLPEYRGRGFGRAILLKSIETLQSAGAAEVMLQVSADNATALGLYKSCGFTETSVMDYYLLQ